MTRVCGVVVTDEASGGRTLPPSTLPANTNNRYPRDMAKNTSVSLDEHYTDFLAEEIASGRYRTSSEVIRAGLRLLEDQEVQMRALRAALDAGEKSGPAEPLDIDAFIAGKRG